jgi:hypothetical protein
MGSSVVLEPLDLVGRLGPDLSDKVVANLGAGRSDSPVSEQLRTMTCKRLINVERFDDYFATLATLTWATPSVINEHRDIVEWTWAVHASLKWLVRDIDIILLLDVLEHFKKQQALELLDAWRDIARERIVIWLPFGPCIQEALDGNEYQRHLSTWEPEDFQRFGTEVEFLPNFHTHVAPPANAGWVIEYLDRGVENEA